MKELQREIILKELLSGDSISPYDAYRHHSIMRLADIIFKLRRQGYVIKDHNNGKPFSDYYMQKNTKYAIQQFSSGLYLFKVVINEKSFVWTDFLDEALTFRAKLYDIVNYLQNELKMKIGVVEK